MPSRAKQSVRFIERYHSYVINYNLGEDLVRNYVKKAGGTDANPSKRWQLFEQLLKSPHLPSDWAVTIEGRPSEKIKATAKCCCKPTSGRIAMGLLVSSIGEDGFSPRLGR